MEVCVLFWEFYPPEDVCPLARGRPELIEFALCSGNGLVSYYIRLLLEEVGVKDPNTQGAINGGLQVSKLTCVYYRHHQYVCELIFGSRAF
jgi:hypothetical protein